MNEKNKQQPHPKHKNPQRQPDPNHSRNTDAETQQHQPTTQTEAPEKENTEKLPNPAASENAPPKQLLLEHRPKLKIGISVGDINGIGIEVIMKTFSDPRMLHYCTPIIYSSSKVIAYHRKMLQMQNEFAFQTINDIEQINPDVCNVLNCWNEDTAISIGQPNPKVAKYALKSLETAMFHLTNETLDAIVTAPVNKNLMNSADLPHKFVGHTEYITQKLGVKESVMLLMSNELRVALVTNHLPISEVARKITPELILQKIRILNHSLKRDFGIQRPKIAVLALNPHAGDNGLIGHEEIQIIRPALERAREEYNILAFGSFAADGFFGTGLYKKYDATLAMYHDQGLVPFKAISFGQGVNYTAGLPIIRTSPDHGTAYDIAGQNIAEEDSFRQAIFTALDICRNRKQYDELTANPLQHNLLREFVGISVDEVEDEILNDE